MATGEAKKHFAETGRRVAFIDWRGRHHWHEVFENNPTIVRPDEMLAAGEFDVLRQGGGERPYIEKKLSRLWVWKPYRPEPGQLFLTDDERRWGEQFAGLILIDPYGKRLGHSNKQWGTANWANLVRELLRHDIEVAHMGPEGTKQFPGTRFLKTPTFRHAAAIMAVARACVTQEGGLHHLAAAFRVPAVVIWSEFISPAQTGYDFQTNLRHAGAPCGMRVDCDRCRRSLDAITPAEVAAALRERL
jgi:ADP-heptose:LPS heptosyltransferase